MSESPIQRYRGVEFVTPSLDRTPPPRMTALTYRWVHIPTGKQGQREVWLMQPALLAVLLDYWNKCGMGTWLYTSA